MFHFSTDRLAGLDTVILRITPPKVPTLIATSHVPKRPRPPLADKNNVAPRPPHPTSSMLVHIHSDAILVSQKRSPPSPLELPAFRPLPPLPSASTLELPPFLNFSDQSFTSLTDPPPRISTPSPSGSSLSPSRRVKTKVFEGPQWIPAFHHPNSPYVPWPSPVRRRILSPPSPLSPSLVYPSSPPIRSGAVAPEPWASSTFSQTHGKSTKEKISGSWRSFKNSIKQGVKTIISRLGKSSKSLRICTHQTMLRTYDDTDVDPSGAVRSALTTARCGDPCRSLASLVSSDSRTLAAWLVARCADASVDDVPRLMSVEEYELEGSWLDVRSCDSGWVCGMQDCGVHTASGSPCAASEYPDGLRMVMPFDSADLLSAKHPPPGTAPALTFPSGPFYTPPRFESLPRLPSQSVDIYSAQEDAQRCSARRRRSS